MNKFLQRYEIVSFPTQDVSPLHLQKDSDNIYAHATYNPSSERDPNKDYLHLYLLDWQSEPVADDTTIHLFKQDIKVVASTDVELGVPTFLDDYILQAYCQFGDYLNIKYITEYSSENKISVSYDTKTKFHVASKEEFISDYKEFLTDREKYRDLSVNVKNPFDYKSQREKEALKVFCSWLIGEDNIEELKNDYDMLPDNVEIVIENNWDTPIFSKVW